METAALNMTPASFDPILALVCQSPLLIEFSQTSFLIEPRRKSPDKTSTAMIASVMRRNLKLYAPNNHVAPFVKARWAEGPKSPLGQLVFLVGIVTDIKNFSAWNRLDSRQRGDCPAISPVA